METLIRKDRYIIQSIEDLKMYCPDENEKLEEILFFHVTENDPKILKTEIFDVRIFLIKKLAFP